MIMIGRPRRFVAWYLPGLLMMGAVMPASAAIDNFKARHKSGACSSFEFETGSSPWQGRDRISIATGERISIRLYGFLAENAEGATGNDIFEWIEARDSGWVDVNIRAAAEHGTGNRTVTVKWPMWMGGGSETIQLKIVATCAELDGSPLRSIPTYTGRLAGAISPSPYANLRPSVQQPVILARLMGAAVPTTLGNLFQISTAFCTGLASNVVRFRYSDGT